MKKTFKIIGFAAMIVCLLTACGGEETLRDQPMTTTTSAKSELVLKVSSIQKLLDHLKESGIVWQSEQELPPVIVGVKKAVRLVNGDKHIDIYLFDLENGIDTIKDIKEFREIEFEGNKIPVEWKEPFAVYVQDSAQKLAIESALRSFQ